MTAKKIQLLTIATSFLILLGAKANDIPEDQENYLAYKARDEIVLDGDLSEWVGANQVVNPQFAVPKGEGAEECGSGGSGDP